MHWGRVVLAYNELAFLMWHHFVQPDARYCIAAAQAWAIFNFVGSIPIVVSGFLIFFPSYSSSPSSPLHLHFVSYYTWQQFGNFLHFAMNKVSERLCTFVFRFCWMLPWDNSSKWHKKMRFLPLFCHTPLRLEDGKWNLCVFIICAAPRIKVLKSDSLNNKLYLLCHFNGGQCHCDVLAPFYADYRWGCFQSSPHVWHQFECILTHLFKVISKLYIACSNIHKMCNYRKNRQKKIKERESQQTLLNNLKKNRVLLFIEAILTCILHCTTRERARDRCTIRITYRCFAQRC